MEKFFSVNFFCVSGILQLRPSAYHLIIIMLEIREKILHFDEVWYGAAWCVDDWAIKLRLGCTHTLMEGKVTLMQE